MDEASTLVHQRIKKLEDLRREGIDPFPNHFRATHTSQELHQSFDSLPDEELKSVGNLFRVAGRIMAIRDFGKARFVHLQDRKGRIQAYLRRDKIGDQAFQLLKRTDIGDIIGVEGKLFRTKTHELTLEVERFQLLTKSLHPLPEKWHGLTDVEARYRQRYLDLLVNPKVKEIFLIRARALEKIRSFFIHRDYVEVETPMMHPIPGGATARPFQTHHNALDMELYMRVAPELYLKRLVIGGLERVFEINRCFRNEGISTQHNPEFTMLEFYQSYATYEDMMAMTEELFCSIVRDLFGKLQLTYQGKEIDFTPPWRRIPFKESLVEFGEVNPSVITDFTKAVEMAKGLNLEVKKGASHGRILADLFDELVEPKLVQPTFVTLYPTDVSPLSRRNPENPDVVDRFELFVAGREIANGFSELNDPVDQRERFVQQLREKGAETNPSLQIDEDFLRALEHGMPPTAGEGIGIDRLVMLLTDAPSIRDVIFFPLLRMEK